MAKVILHPLGESLDKALDAAEARYGASPGRDEAETLAMACAANGRFEDAVDFQTQAIFEALKEGALTLQAGGGVGYDFSTLRPAGSAAAPCNPPRRTAPSVRIARRAHSPSRSSATIGLV